MGTGVSESQFYMWRTLFAVAHADEIVTKEEIEFMAHVLEDVNFSDEQTSILKDDIVNAKDIEMMFKGITDQDDRVRFFDFARDLVWVDGDFGSAEQGVMVKLFQDHFRQTNVDELIGKVRFELEEDSQPERSVPQNHNSDGDAGLRGALAAFQRRFLRMFGG